MARRNGHIASSATACPESLRSNVEQHRCADIEDPYAKNTSGVQFSVVLRRQSETPESSLTDTFLVFSTAQNVQ